MIQPAMYCCGLNMTQPITKANRHTDAANISNPSDSIYFIGFVEKGSIPSEASFSIIFLD